MWFFIVFNKKFVMPPSKSFGKLFVVVVEDETRFVLSAHSYVYFDETRLERTLIGAEMSSLSGVVSLRVSTDAGLGELFEDRRRRGVGVRHCFCLYVFEQLLVRRDRSV